MVKKLKAIFFDRDGTLIKTKLSKDNKPIAIKNIKELEIYQSVKKILNKLSKDYLIFLITNQPDVGRKKNTKKNVEEINNHLKDVLPIKKIYTCYCDNNNCKYRKPNIGMILDASNQFNLDLKKSFVIGDRWKDITAGVKAKCKTIFINRNYNEKVEHKADFIVNDFYEIKKIFK